MGELLHWHPHWRLEKRREDGAQWLARGQSIEDFLAGHGAPLGQARVSEASLFIYPPYSFRGVDALITNFHLPRSTLLMLVAAFCSPGKTDGLRMILAAYEAARRARYRFYSYGDAMLIE